MKSAQKSHGYILGNKREIRVRVENAEAMVECLRNSGYEAAWRNGCHTRLNGGCDDPDCCTQHISEGQQELWATITTTASGNLAHKIWSENGIVQSRFGK